MSRIHSFCLAAGLIALAGCSGALNRALPAAMFGANARPDSGMKRATNLIVNGSFEKPTAPSGSYLSFNKGDTFTGWTVSGASGSIAIVGKNFSYGGYKIGAGCGDQLVDLTGSSDTKTGVKQRVATTPSASYTLSFQVGNAWAASGNIGKTSTVLVYLNGRKWFSATNKKGKGVLHEVWQTFSKSFVAKSKRTTIEFLNGDPVTDTDNGLDCVSLVPAN